MISRFLNHLRNEHGSLKGSLRHYVYRFLTKIGLYRRYLKFDCTITQVVFVCSGNICRSPLAAYTAHQSTLKIKSYGLHCRGGDPADPRAIAFAERYNIDMKHHITANIKDYTPQEQDLIVGMEPSHIKELRKLFPKHKNISSLGLWHSQSNIFIADPYSCSNDFFEKCEKKVMESTINLMHHVKKS